MHALRGWRKWPPPGPARRAPARSIPQTSVDGSAGPRLRTRPADRSQGRTHCGHSSVGAWSEAQAVGGGKTKTPRRARGWPFQRAILSLLRGLPIAAKVLFSPSPAADERPTAQRDYHLGLLGFPPDPVRRSQLRGPLIGGRLETP